MIFSDLELEVEILQNLLSIHNFQNKISKREERERKKNFILRFWEKGTGSEVYSQLLWGSYIKVIDSQPLES